MSTDQKHRQVDNPEPKKPPGQIFDHEIREGLHALERPFFGLFVSGLSAGLSERFTEQTTLAVLPVLGGRASVGAMLQLWAVVYVSSLIGAARLAAMISYVSPSMEAVEPRYFGKIARRLTDPTGLVILLSGVLAGSALVACGRVPRHHQPGRSRLAYYHVHWFRQPLPCRPWLG